MSTACLTASMRRSNSRRRGWMPCGATSKALKSLYAALSDAQKEIANQLIRSSTGMM